jgi:hypothetical protein
MNYILLWCYEYIYQCYISFINFRIEPTIDDDDEY